MSVGDQLHAQSSYDNASDYDEDESEWASRHDDTADVLDAAAVALASNGAREWDATAGALHQQSPAVRDLAHGMLASETAVHERKEDAMELAVLGDTCPICLQGLVDAAMVQPCYHVYCFECISTWVESLALHGVVPPTCPLCKTTFATVYTNVATECDYEVVRFGNSSQPRMQQMQQMQQQQLRRRSLVYRRRMRLATVNGVATALDDDALPRVVKVRGEYDSWLERELAACIGADVDVTVLVTLIQCCLDTIAPPATQAAAMRGYRDLQATLQPFLFDDTALFVRELSHFLGSRLNVDAYDAALAYVCTSTSACATALCVGRHDSGVDSDL